MNNKNSVTHRRTHRIREHPKTSLLREILNLALKAIGIGTVFVLVFTFVFGLYRNTEPDMVPMIKHGDLILFYRIDKKYFIGDLVLLNFNGKRQIRRVVAKSGDTVNITEDGLVINGALQQELEIYQQTNRYENGIKFPFTVEKDQIFVLSDARINGTDSRVYGPVKTKDTLGKAIAIMRRRNL